MLCSNTFTTRNRLTSGTTETASLLLQNLGLLLNHFYTRGLPGFKALSQTKLSSQSHHPKDVPQPVVLRSSCIMINMKNVLAACFPLNRSSTKTKTEEENKKNVHGVDVGPAARSVCGVSVGLPLTAPQDAVHFFVRAAAGGRLRWQMGREDQARTHTLSDTL